jgi:NAD(P)H-dependent FMN reductase
LAIDRFWQFSLPLCVFSWTAAIAQSDGFVFVTPEYNYGPSTVLKNAIDWVYPE